MQIKYQRDSKGRFKKGRVVSLDEKLFLSETLKGRKKPKGFAEKLRKANLGKKHSPETLEKLRQLQIKRWENPNFRNSLLKNLRGCKHSLQARKKKSKITKEYWKKAEYREKIKKARNGVWSWKGGHILPKYFKKFILKRDNNQCQLCSSTNRVSIHHIDGNSKRHSKKNCICLCSPCHTKIHNLKRFHKIDFSIFFYLLLVYSYNYKISKVNLICK